MAMDMERLDSSQHCVLEALNESSCIEDSVGVDVSSVFLEDKAQVGAAGSGESETTSEFPECLNFVTDSSCGGDVDVLDYDCKLPDEVSGVEGELLESVSFDEQSVKQSLEENLELRELRELLGSTDHGVNSSVNNEVGEEEALLLAKAQDASVSLSDSGECISGGDRKQEAADQVSLKCSKNLPGAQSTTATATATKKKAKVDWTPELHRRFVHAVEQLGVEKAFPSRILELMGVQCLTRHNIASHLQKYRSHRRHLAAREADAASWSQRRTYTQAPWPRTSSRRDGSLPYLVPLHTPHIQPRPAPMSTLQPAPLKVWGYPTVDHSSVHMWQQPAVPPPSYWQAADGSYWQHPAAVAAAGTYDGFSPRPACFPQPMRVPVASPMVAMPGYAAADDSGYYGDDQLYLYNQFCDSDIGRAAGAAAYSKPAETPLSKEVLDAAIGEALANPWTPPPLGLKPPSMEGVIAELQRQGINTVPPSTC